MRFIGSILFKIQFYFPHKLLRYLKKKHQLSGLKNWSRNGSPVPPPHIVKVIVLKQIAKKKSLIIFLETGTFMGDMLEEMKYNFKKLYSIEIFEPLYLRALKIFRGHSHIKLIHGDSAIYMKDLVKNISEPTLFWLDAHYSGKGTGKSNVDTPIENELKTISGFKNDHVIVIDDARLFVGKNSYPELELIKKKYRSTYTISVIHDMIVLAK